MHISIYAQCPVKGILADSVDPDQTPQTAASDQGLHCLHYIQDFYHILLIIKLTRHPPIGNGPVQRVEVEEYTRHKWINFNRPHDAGHVTPVT